jgi:hypothetical protein
MDDSKMREPRNGGSGVAWVSRFLQCGPGQTLFHCCQACGLRSPGSHVAGNGNGGEENLHRVIVVRDAVCSSSDEGHEMLMRLYHTRYTEQIETADAATIVTRWE